MEESNSNLDRLLQWVKKGTRLYEEDDKFDVCRPNKSTLIHYHDAEKGKEKGSVEKQMMIFSIISPACVSKLGWSCGRLSMDRASPPEYYFQTVLRQAEAERARETENLQRRQLGGEAGENPSFTQLHRQSQARNPPHEGRHLQLQYAPVQ